MEQCEEVKNLRLEDGTKKIFLNMIYQKLQALFMCWQISWELLYIHRSIQEDARIYGAMWN